MVDNRPLPGSADVFDAGLFRTEKDSARSSRAGTQGDFFVIHTPDLVLVVTLTCDRELAPVRQWRHGSRTASLEVPGRLHNGPTKHNDVERPVNCSRRPVTATVARRCSESCGRSRPCRPTGRHFCRLPSLPVHRRWQHR